MIGEFANDKRCPLCGGFLKKGFATIPFVVGGAVYVVKDVPAEICQSCHEPFMQGEVVDRLTAMLKPLYRVKAEMSVLIYEPADSAAALVAETRAEYKTQPMDDPPSEEAGI